MSAGPLWIPLAVACLACHAQAARSNAPTGGLGAMALASGVTRADSAMGGRAPRILPLRPPPGDVEILYGDPEAPRQPFVMRIRELPGTVVPPHSHPVDEHLTVLQGTWYFGLGETYDSTKLHALPAGSYAFAPAGTTMFGYAPDSAIVQVHGIGPFRIFWRDAAASLRDVPTSSAFQFRLGDRVRAPRGDGVIKDGYASGPVVQYDIERADGSRFFAHERDLQVP
jgi:quercetin dioxygenase-like cupin family protein